MTITTNIPAERLLYVEHGAETVAYRKGDKVDLTVKRGRVVMPMTGTIHKICDAAIELNTSGLGELNIIMFYEIKKIEKTDDAKKEVKKPSCIVDDYLNIDEVIDDVLFEKAKNKYPLWIGCDLVIVRRKRLNIIYIATKDCNGHVQIETEIPYRISGTIIEGAIRRVINDTYYKRY